MQYLDGFSWSVPIAFAGAVSACRFEQGDVLYDDKAGYRPWATASGRVTHAIQVVDPPKGNRAMSSDQASSRFLANWDSEVTFSLIDIASGDAEQRTTSQGRLFSFLWRGETALLDAGSEAPEPPLMQRDLHRVLDASLDAFRRRFAKKRGRGSKSGPGGVLYVSAVDLSSDASRAKAFEIEGALAERFPVDALDLAPSRAGIEAADRYHPALVLRGLLARGASEAEVEATLKRKLYAPGSAREGKTDRFSLARHGLLAPLSADA